MLAECLPNVVNAGPESKGRWQAPALSSLVSRLAQPSGKPPQPSSPSWHQPPPQADQEVFLDASSDEEDTEAAPAGPGPEAGGQELNLSIYSAAAGPFKALLACVGQAPGASYLFYHAAILWNHIHTQHLLVCSAATQKPVTQHTTVFVLPLLVGVYCAANGVLSVSRSSVLLLLAVLLLYRLKSRRRCRQDIHIFCGVAVHSDMHACHSKPVSWSRSSSRAILSKLTASVTC